ncbi:MAG: fasciclin domain-containing protein, partial [candidate division Zixibacteria bacterium]|nr:fasciclin domain-containing protein [candidate division Zixibacteria bacterium]
ELLKGTGPFTVFAPTNAAFDKLPAGSVAEWMKAENKATLVKILTYHMVPGRYGSGDLRDGMSLKTVQGQSLIVNYKDGSWWVNREAIVTAADLEAKNGVVHEVDTVVRPIE